MKSKTTKPKRASTAEHIMDMCSRIYKLVSSDTETLISVEQFHKLKFPSTEGTTPLQFAKAYLRYHLLRKNNFVDLGLDRKGLALSQFLAVEERVRVKNLTLLKDCHKVAASPVLYRASRKISRLLGDFSWDYVLPHLDMTSGASTRLTRAKGNAGFKFCGKPHCTPQAQHLVNLFLYTDPVYMKQLTEFGPVEPKSLTTVVPSSRLDFVPKSYKIDRTICIEPEMNMFFQRGIGRLIRSKLLKAHIDLKDQSRNQYLAFHGSVMGDLATIDLEAASDSLSLELCYQLLPHDWFEAMDMVRSHYVTLPDGSLHYLSKISSMGNGFTFELETLVFWAIASAVIEEVGCRDKTLAVYGDDIIVPVEAADRVIEVLFACGFHTNKEKTFTHGPFRESCGKHYFLGHDVTPFNVKDLHGNITDALYIYNSFAEWCLRVGMTCPSPRKFGIVGNHPLVPPRYGPRAGIICLENPYRANRHGLFTIEYYTYVQRPIRAPHFGNYYMSLLRHTETPRSDVRLAGRRLVRRKSEYPVSHWD